MSNKFFRQTLAQIKYNSKEIKLLFPYVVQAQYEHCKQLIPIYNTTVYKNCGWTVGTMRAHRANGKKIKRIKVRTSNVKSIQIVIRECSRNFLRVVKGMIF